MTEALNTINEWIADGEPIVLIARQSRPITNLWTWCSWLIANASTGLYMWTFQSVCSVCARTSATH